MEDNEVKRLYQQAHDALCTLRLTIDQLRKGGLTAAIKMGVDDQIYLDIRLPIGKEWAAKH